MYCQEVRTFLPNETFTNYKRNIFREMKKEMCYVALDFLQEVPSLDTYTLPDGSIISVGSERTKTSETLFQPSILGKPGLGIHESAMQSIMRCDDGNRAALFNNISLSGGTTNLKGIEFRLHKEIAGFYKRRTINVVRQQKQDMAWHGAS